MTDPINPAGSGMDMANMPSDEECADKVRQLVEQCDERHNAEICATAMVLELLEAHGYGKTAQVYREAFGYE